jgi:putative ATP-dependent endonuclease of OLD family
VGGTSRMRREPHVRSCERLGVKFPGPTRQAPLQVFATTHSPVAVRELAAAQLHVVRSQPGGHIVIRVGDAVDVQGTIRVYPEAFLASSVIVCEGASEVGLLRGLDLYLTRNDLAPSLTARGVALVDAGGVTKLYGRVKAFVTLGYRTLALRDDDAQPLAADEAAFVAGGGKVVAWRPGRALEDELFACLPPEAVTALIERASEIHGEALIEDHIRSASGNTLSLRTVRRCWPVPAGRSLAKRPDRSRAGSNRCRGWRMWRRISSAPTWQWRKKGSASLSMNIFRWME